MTKKPESNELSIIERAGDLELVVSECSITSTKGLSSFARSAKLVKGLRDLRNIIDQSMTEELMLLQGRTLGFRTDKDGKGGYPPEVVKDCAIEAILRGVTPTGNEFNIIAGRCYITKEGYQRLCSEFPGLSKLVVTKRPPQPMKNDHQIVECEASWDLNGERGSLVAEIPVRVNNGMGADAVLGKAHRKMLARVFEVVSGWHSSDIDLDELGSSPKRVSNTAARSTSSELASQIGAAESDQTERESAIAE